MALIEKTTESNFWELHIEQWQVSGLSKVKYCEHHGLRAHQLGYWDRKFLVNDNVLESEPKTGFARVKLATSLSSTLSNSDLSLHFADGTQLTGITHHNLALLKQLLEVLR